MNGGGDGGNKDAEVNGAECGGNGNTEVNRAEDGDGRVNIATQMEAHFMERHDEMVNL